MAVTGRRVNQSGAGFARRRFGARVTDIQLNFSISFAAECDVLAEHEQRRPINPWVLRFESIEFGTREARQYLWIGETTSRGYAVKQLSRDNVDFITAGERDVFKIRMHRNAEIRR